MTKPAKIVFLVLVHRPEPFDLLMRLIGDRFDCFVHVDARVPLEPFTAVAASKTRFIEKRTPIFWCGSNMMLATLDLIGAAMDAALELNAGVPIQIEVETLDELESALAHRAQSILLDNFSLDMMRDAVRITAGRAVLEVSGGVNFETVRTIAETGVDRVSVGALTKDVRATDYSMRIV